MNLFLICLPPSPHHQPQSNTKMRRVTKHPKATILALFGLLILAGPAAGQAQFTYMTNDDHSTITIIGYAGPGGAVTIPDTITGLPVTSIADFAFYARTSLTSVTIPNSVTNIGFEAFYDCTSLTSVTIPHSVTSIGGWAFQYCTNLGAITVDVLNSVYSSVAGVLFDRSQTTLIAYPGGKAGDYTIPNSITNIGVGAFGGCTSLTSVTIPISIANIGDSAFYSCTSLTSVTIPNSVTNIGNSAFYSCTGLTSVTVGNGVTSIGDYAFASCYGLARATIGSSVAKIGYGTFSDSGLKSVTLPKSVRMIGDAAFEYCSNLTSVTIGNGVSSIADFAFDACASLTSVLIGNSVSSIGVAAFGRCTSLTSATIPSSVTSIGDAAFLGCTSLTAVYFQGNAPSDGGAVFSGDYNATIYYLPRTTGWGMTFGGLPTVLWNPHAQTTDVSFGVQRNQFGFDITGTANIPVVVEASTNLIGFPWTTLLTGNITNGSIHFSDSQWTNFPSRYYRIRSP